MIEAPETPTVALVGTMDTKGPEYSFIRSELSNHGVSTIVVDIGVHEPKIDSVDVDRFEVARVGGGNLNALAHSGDRSDALATMRRGARGVVQQIAEENRAQSFFAMGGSGGTSLAAYAFRGLPIGIPKMIVSTVASGQVAPLIGTSDLILVPSIVDIAGLNPISRNIFSNAAAGIAGMATTSLEQQSADDSAMYVAATMFGNTMTLFNGVSEGLSRESVNIIPFHATKPGSETLDALVQDGFLEGVLELTLSGLASELLDSPWATDSNRLRAAVERGIPAVVASGAIDMAVFSPPDTIPESLRSRPQYEHNPDTILVRTSAEENKVLAERVAERLRGAEDSCVFVLPLRGFSETGSPGMPFHDPEADAAFIDTIRECCPVPLIEVDDTINGDATVSAVVNAFRGLVTSQQLNRTTGKLL